MATRKGSTTTTAQVPTVSELPVTRAMLHGVRDELKSRIDQTNARIDQTNAHIDQTNASVVGMRAEVMAEVHRLGTLVEEQEARNRVVLEVVQGHAARFERIERRLDGQDDMLREILAFVRQRPTP